MKSSVRISRGGRSITFRGAAARACFEALSGTKLPLPEAPRKMDPNRFVVGERVRYVNHVANYEIGILEVVSVGEFIEAKKFFGTDTFKFHPDGIATWSPNLSIKHE